MRPMLFAFLLLTLAHELEAAAPNIVVIMVDDFGYECITANGGESYQTPHIDALAASGVRFENCHVQPLCTPTRVQLMTGKYNIRNYLQFGILPRGETTFAQLLKGGGYTTGVCGKWQLGREVDSPQHFGFDESCLWQHTRLKPRYANPGLEYNGVQRGFKDGEYGPQLINDFALDFITRHRDQPFFLYYPMILTHDPFQPTPESPDWDHTISSEAVLKDVKHFAEMTEFADQMVGNVIGKLDELGIRDNTLILFLGDNGTHRKITTQFKGEPYQGGKSTTTARGTHVPLIANWPSVIETASVNPDLISSTDFLPTICEVAGVKIPDQVDGVSFLPQLKSEPGKPREWLYTWYSPRQRQNLTVRECAFDLRFKLYRTGEFFDLVSDPFEEHGLTGSDLSGDAKREKEELRAVLDQFQNARPESLDQQFIKNKGLEKN